MWWKASAKWRGYLVTTHIQPRIVYGRPVLAVHIDSARFVPDPHRSTLPFETQRLQPRRGLSPLSTALRGNGLDGNNNNAAIALPIEGAVQPGLLLEDVPRTAEFAGRNHEQIVHALRMQTWQSIAIGAIVDLDGTEEEGAVILQFRPRTTRAHQQTGAENTG